MGYSRGSGEIYILIAIIIIAAFFLVGGFSGGFKNTLSPEEKAAFYNDEN